MNAEHRTKLSVTVDPHLYRAVTRYAEGAKVSKSHIIEDALRLWEKHQLILLAKEGYQKMADEDVQEAEAYASVLSDIEAM